MPKRLYFDHNATSPLRPQGRLALEQLWSSGAANPSSVHAEGRRARLWLEEAREQVAALLEVSPSRIFFTSGGTEACNSAVALLAAHARAYLGSILRSAVEHPAVTRALDAHGEGATSVVGEGAQWSAETWTRALDAPTAGIACMAANNETGIIHPVVELGGEVKRQYPTALVYTDAVQALGRMDCRSLAQSADLLSASGHKLGGLPGAGFLYARKGIEARPLLWGGKQERGWRGGTESLAAIVTLGAAAEALRGFGEEERLRTQLLRDELQKGILELAPNAVVHGGNVERLPNTLMISFPGWKGDVLAMALDLRGVAASTGSACASGAAEASAVLLAMGVSPVLAGSALRFSLGWSTERTDILDLLSILRGVLANA